MKHIKIIVVGHKGKMGSVVFDSLKTAGYDVFGIDKNDSIENIKDANLVIDFSNAEQSAKTANWCAENKVKLIIGATGQSKEQLEQIKNASRKTAILKAGNFSIGIAKIKTCLKHIFDGSETQVVVFETHHKNKLDKPSGTALELVNDVQKTTNVPVDVLSERIGCEVGEHIVKVCFENEVVSLSHKAYSRVAFADGVLLAVSFMLKFSGVGLYDFESVIE